MNSTQTPTARTEHPHDAPSAPNTKLLVPRWQAKYITSQLWIGILEQDHYWVPRGAWDAYADVSVHNVTLDVAPVFEVDGVAEVVSMDMSWRQQVVRFLWCKSASIAYGQAVNLFGIVSGPYDPAGPDDHAGRYSELVRNSEARQTWFSQFPLISTLRESVITERNARIPRPVVLDPAPAPTPRPSGLLLPS